MMVSDRGELRMKTITVQAEVTVDQVLKIEVPCDVPPGQVEVVLTIQPHRPRVKPDAIDWSGLLGLGREVWQGVDASAYVDELRADREPAK
jgi:hypothetical protein